MSFVVAAASSSSRRGFFRYQLTWHTSQNRNWSRGMEWSVMASRGRPPQSTEISLHKIVKTHNLFVHAHGRLPPSKHRNHRSGDSWTLAHNPNPCPNSSKAHRRGPVRHTPQGRGCRLGPTGRRIREGNGGLARRGRAVPRDRARRRESAFGRTRGGKKEKTSTGLPHATEARRVPGPLGKYEAPPSRGSCPAASRPDAATFGGSAKIHP